MSFWTSPQWKLQGQLWPVKWLFQRHVPKHPGSITFLTPRKGEKTKAKMDLQIKERLIWIWLIAVWCWFC